LDLTKRDATVQVAVSVYEYGGRIQYMSPNSTVVLIANLHLLQFISLAQL